jgi:hypothetical protein
MYNFLDLFNVRTRRPLALAILTWLGSSLLAVASAGEEHTSSRAEPGPKRGFLFHRHRNTTYGAFRDGTPARPGFQGFGLGYHLGYGYGGDALGVGGGGGYPFYAGPGYPHAEPQLRRKKGIVPFPHLGGPGHPTPANPNFFGRVGPLVVDSPVVRQGPHRGENDYGAFTGTLPYPENLFAPFTTEATSAAPSWRAPSPPPPPIQPLPAVQPDPASPATPPRNHGQLETPTTP